MCQEAAASTCGRATGGSNTDAIVGHDYFKRVVVRVPRGFKEKAQATMHIGAASMAGSGAQRLLRGGKNQFSGGGGRPFIDIGGGFIGHTTLHFIERILKIFLYHCMNCLHHANAPLTNGWA